MVGGQDWTHHGCYRGGSPRPRRTSRSRWRTGDLVDLFALRPGRNDKDLASRRRHIRRLAEIRQADRLLDPCMGSGHFLVFALPLLVRLRMEEEELNAQTAVVAVLKDNIHGLELDERCTQIAAFNVALTAWKLAGYQACLACTWLALALRPVQRKPSGWSWRETMTARRGMERLYGLFKEAPVLGSLIDPAPRRGSPRGRVP